MSTDSLLQQVPSVQQLLNSIINGMNTPPSQSVDDKDHFRDMSLIVDTSLLQKAAAIIDNRQVKRVLTVPGSIVFYEFTVANRRRMNNRNREEEKPSTIASLITATVTNIRSVLRAILLCCWYVLSASLLCSVSICLLLL